MSNTETIREDLLDSDDWEYYLAGMLIGTRWKHPEHGEIVVGKAQRTKERHEGEEMPYPEITLKYWGKRMSVSGFLQRIDVNDMGDIKPFGRKAEKIVSIQKQNSWRNMKVSFE